jgi:hypothetical protein
MECRTAGARAPKAGLYSVASAAYASSPSATTFIYLLDGFDPSPLWTWAATYKYDTLADVWTSVKKIPTLRALSSTEKGAMAATAASNIYVMGGGSRPVNMVPANRLRHEAYSPLADTWTTKANMPAEYVGGAIGVWGASPSAGTVLVAGGYPAVVTLHLYNAAQDAWRAGTAYPHDGPRLGTAAPHRPLHRRCRRRCRFHDGKSLSVLLSITAACLMHAVAQGRTCPQSHSSARAP